MRDTLTIGSLVAERGQKLGSGREGRHVDVGAAHFEQGVRVGASAHRQAVLLRGVTLSSPATIIRA